ncbi:hypothetical protein, partial [Boseongicola aestuarii]|uniref:hypothetical protein n=1 Tax=Boseongicola aestuarii TaxID=1470561 RepID=UPI001C3E7024
RGDQVTVSDALFVREVQWFMRDGYTPKRTLVRGAANDGLEPNVSHAARVPNVWFSEAMPARGDASACRSVTARTHSTTLSLGKGANHAE